MSNQVSSNYRRATLLTKKVGVRTYQKIRQFYASTIEPIGYIGHKFTCPICGWHFRKMKAYRNAYYVKGELIDHSADNAMCPRCRSAMRHRFIFTFLKNYTNLLTAELHVLHFAPEPYIAALIKKQKQIEYVSCDLNPASYPGAVKVDITNIQWAEGAFDAVICIHVLEHICDDVQAIRELYRILRPGGWALIALPIYGEQTFEDPTLDYQGRQRMYGIGDHVRMNGLDLKGKLTDAGFSVKVYSTDEIPGTYIDRSVQSLHFESDKYLFFCQK